MKKFWTATSIGMLLADLMGWEEIAATFALAFIVAEIREVWIRKDTGMPFTDFVRPLVKEHVEMLPVAVGWIGWFIWLVMESAPGEGPQSVVNIVPFDLGLAWLVPWVLVGLVIHFMPGLFRWLPWADR